MEQNGAKMEPNADAKWVPKRSPFGGQKLQNPFEFLVSSLKMAPRRGSIFSPKVCQNCAIWCQNGTILIPKWTKTVPKSIGIVAFLRLGKRAGLESFQKIS